MKKLLIVIIFVLFCAQVTYALTPAEAAEKLKTLQASNINAPEALSESQMQGFINSHTACEDDSDCINILANCFGCTVAVNRKFAQDIYQNLAAHHMRYGQCKKQCKLGAPAPVCQNKHCILP